MTDPTICPEQADIRAALEHLGWDDYEEFCEWAISNHEMDRFDELVAAFARHRIQAQSLVEKAVAERNAALEIVHLTTTPEPKPCEHDWRYSGTDRGGSHKGEDAYVCTKCRAWEYRP